ncbi:putative dimethylsulfoxide reductase, chain B [Desulfitobacterium hafniense DP7]|uniref:Putative dimethylsulfoxide reductase, chain B n=1 Tax=Desulfitobacterium hafniense DP7 TaxID=537010 RepID=G9XGR0_DESHA|nr:4Fe-4S dicluster domain-containing protein [Desulfitobacterium hafniense]EHL09095.1 putative dimethylsulfoxide reductase, chain B [Desulfitobacterium hafniense DP7]
MTQYAFYFDQSRCYSCQACSLACKDWNNLGIGPEKWMTVYEWEEGSLLHSRIHVVAFSCGHCENPVCLKACPNHAIFKETKYGAVLIDQDKCKGTRQCAVVCPYGAPKFADDAPGTKMSKCTMCIDRLEQGDLPICVASCPMRALDFGTLEQMIMKYGNNRQLAGMPEADITRPAVIMTPQAPKKELIPYDKDKAVVLLQQRGELGKVFENIDDLTDLPDDLMNRNRLAMKFRSQDSMLEFTKNHMG